MTLAELFGAGDYIQDCLLLAHTEWLQQMITKKKIIPHDGFIRHQNFSGSEIKAFLLNSKAPPCQSGELDPWRLVSVEQFPLRNESVYPSFLFDDSIKPSSVKNGLSKDDCFAEILQYIEENNFMSLWHDAFERYDSSYKVRDDFTKNTWHSKSDIDKSYIPHNKALLEIINRLYQCPIIDARSDT